MSDLRRAAEMALEALETLWDILDDIDTTSDIAKENDAWYRKRVEFLQKKRWDTTITTDGYKLKGGAVEALRTALAQTEQECIYPECETGIGCDGPCGEKPVDTVNTSQERVDETAKYRHEPVAWILRIKNAEQDVTSLSYWPNEHYPSTPLYTVPPKREWVGLTREDKAWAEMLNEPYGISEKAYLYLEAKLKEKNT